MSLYLRNEALSFQLQTELEIWYTSAKIINYQTT